MVNRGARNGPDRYEIVKPLGLGLGGKTVLARLVPANASQTVVVIKQIYQPQESLGQLTQRLKTLGQHPQLPALLDSWQSPDGQFLVFEHITAPIVSQAEPLPWSPDQLEPWLLCLLPVLEHLHSFRLIHGDIRPENIRLTNDPDQRPILVDLRITQPLNRNTPALATTGGDAAYAAPEQALGQLTYASDLYSLGLVAIHLLTGLSPFDLYSVADSRWIWPDLVTAPLSKNLSQVLHKLLERSLEDRYTSAAQVIADLKKSPTQSLLTKARSFLPTTPPLPQTLQALGSSLSTPAPKLSEGQMKPAPQITWHPLYQLTTGITTALALQGSTLAMGTNKGTILIGDLSAGPDAQPLKGSRHREGRHREPITAVAFHPQGHTLYSACSDGTVKLWDLTRGDLKQTLSQPGWQPTDLAIAPPYLVVGDGGGHITLWDLEQLTLCHRFNQHQDWVIRLATQGNRLASISRDRTLRLWSLSEKRLIETLSISPSQGLALHPSGDYAIVGNDQGQVDVWTVGQSARPDRLCSGSDGITALALSPDARLLAVGTDGNALRVYEGASGQCVSELAQGWGVVAIAFDGHTLVSSSQDETVTVWQRRKPRKATHMT